MYKVVYLPSARQQLKQAVYYIAADLSAPDAASDLADEVDRMVQSLKHMPYRFPIYHSHYAAQREIRFFPVKQYNVFYTINEETKTVTIKRIIHRLHR